MDTDIAILHLNILSGAVSGAPTIGRRLPAVTQRRRSPNEVEMDLLNLKGDFRIGSFPSSIVLLDDTQDGDRGDGPQMFSRCLPFDIKIVSKWPVIADLTPCSPTREINIMYVCMDRYCYLARRYRNRRVLLPARPISCFDPSVQFLRKQ